MPRRPGQDHPRPKDRSSADKGRLVEDITAMLHAAPGLRVERRVKVPVPGDRRAVAEIDVLLTGAIAGYTVRIAIECKNEAKPIGVEYINAHRQARSISRTTASRKSATDAALASRT